MSSGAITTCTSDLVSGHLKPIRFHELSGNAGTVSSWDGGKDFSLLGSLKKPQKTILFIWVPDWKIHKQILRSSNPQILR